MNRLKLKEGGISAAVGISRYNGDRELYERLLSQFPADSSYQKLADALEASDVEAAFQAAHALKGTAGNLALVDLSS